jgi:hypothetical protein
VEGRGGQLGDARRPRDLGRHPTEYEKGLKLKNFKPLDKK